MPAFDQLQPWAFDGLSFAVKSYNVRCKLRDHVHVYPHSPGGAVEKLGRELYTIHVSASFQTTFKKFPNAWPQDLASLRDKFEREITSALLIPTIGTIQAYMMSFDQSGSGKVRSGEYVEIEFREDQDSAFLINQLIDVKVTKLADASKALISAASDAGVTLGTLTGLVSDFAAIGDQVELYGSLASSKLEGIAASCAALDASFDFGLAKNWSMTNALHDVWNSAIVTRQDLLKRSVPIIDYSTPTLMSVTDVAKALYGDSSRASEVMQLNALDDPFRIVANTNLRVYAA